MNIADVKFKELLKHVLEEGVWDENPRPYWLEEDGSHTPAHSLFTTQYMETFDISKGEFPITTIKPTAVKTGIREIFAIYQNQSNKLSEFERLGVHWWNSWLWEDTDLSKRIVSTQLNGTIGKSYPYNLESHRNEATREIVKIKIPSVSHLDTSMEEIKINDIEDNPLEKIGNYQLISKEGKKFKIQSLITGEYQLITKKHLNSLRENGKFACKHNPFNFDRIYYNVGYLGNWEEVANFTEQEIKILKHKWVSMLKRIFSNDEYYKQYYDDTKLHNRWHSFENFLKDVRYLPQYFLAKEDNFEKWELDKDYKGVNIYSKDTCVFLFHDDNMLYRNYKPFKVIHPNGTESIEISQNRFANEHNLSQGNIGMVLNGIRNHTHNYKFDYIDTSNDDFVYRYELSRNQINELIKGIKENPYGRRHIVSLWNWQNIDKKSLVECAFQTLWTVRGEFLDCTLIQRSQDILGANNINNIQYVALQMMVAKHCGLKPGKYTHFIQNVHIYDRHIPIAKEILQRPISEKQPKLIFEPKSNNFYDFTIDDFKVVDYEPQGKIFIPIAI